MGKRFTRVNRLVPTWGLPTDVSVPSEPHPQGPNTSQTASGEPPGATFVAGVIDFTPWQNDPVDVHPRRTRTSC